MSKLLPYETIVKAHEGDPDAIDTILSHYAGYIRYCSKVHGKVNAEVEEHSSYHHSCLPRHVFTCVHCLKKETVGNNSRLVKYLICVIHVGYGKHSSSRK